MDQVTLPPYNALVLVPSTRYDARKRASIPSRVYDSTNLTTPLLHGRNATIPVKARSRLCGWEKYLRYNTDCIPL